MVVKEGAKLLIKAARSLEKGEEIVIDYSTIVGSDDVWRMRCRCGCAHCRRVVKSFTTLPKKTREEYLARGMVPAYIRTASFYINKETKP